MGFVFIYILKLWQQNFLPTVLVQQTAVYSISSPWEQTLFFLPIFMLVIFLMILVFIMIIIVMGLELGFKKLMLNIYDQKQVSACTIFSCFRVLWKHVCASIFFVIIVGIGILLLVLPGIYWSIRFCLFPFFIIDKNEGIMDSLYMSWCATEGLFWELFLVRFIFVLVYGLVVGIFIFIDSAGISFPGLTFFKWLIIVGLSVSGNLTDAYIYQQNEHKQLTNCNM